MILGGTNPWIQYPKVDALAGLSAVSMHAIITYGGTNNGASVIRSDGTYTPLQAWTSAARSHVWIPSIAYDGSNSLVFTAGSRARYITRWQSGTGTDKRLNGTDYATVTTGTGVLSGSATSLNLFAAEVLVEFANNWELAEVAFWGVRLTTADCLSLEKGISPRRVRPQALLWYAPLVRDLGNRKGGVPITSQNVTASPHPRIYP